MAQAINSAIDCCTPCDETPAAAAIPGPSGSDGAAGAAGTNGENAHTTLTLAFTMPALGASDTATVVNTGFMAVNQKVFLGVGASRGWFEVVAILTPTTVTLKNVETATEYLDNSPPTTVFAVGAKLVPGGLQGPTAAAGGGALLAANNLSDLVLASAARTNLGLGTAAVLTAGVANGNLPPVNDAGGLTANESVWATAAGVESRTAILARAGLGLVLGIADTQIPPIQNAAGITAGQALFATAAGMESKTAAAARAALGIAGGIAFHANRNAVNQAGIASGVTTQIEFNNEAYDVGAYYDPALWRFHPLVAGYYALTARVSFAAIGGGAATEYYVQIYKLGVLVASAFLPSDTLSTVSQTVGVSTEQQADGVNDYFDVRVRQTSGFAATLNGVNSTSFFTGHIIAI